MLHVILEVINPDFGRKKHHNPDDDNDHTKVVRIGWTEKERFEHEEKQDKYRNAKRRHGRLKRLAQMAVPTFTFLFIIFYWLSATMRSSTI